MKTIRKLMAIALFGFLATGFEVQAADIVAKISQVSDEALENFVIQATPVQRAELREALGQRLFAIEQGRLRGRPVDEQEVMKLMIANSLLENF